MENTRDILCFFLRKQYCQKLCVYTINGKHTRHSVFLFEKAILSKVVRRGKLINCANVRNFPHLGTKQKERIVKIFPKFDWRMVPRYIPDSFESFPKLCKRRIFWRIVHCTEPNDAATRISMLFFPRNWLSNMSHIDRKGCFSIFANYSIKNIGVFRDTARVPKPTKANRAIELDTIR